MVVSNATHLLHIESINTIFMWIHEYLLHLVKSEFMPSKLLFFFICFSEFNKCIFYKVSGYFSVLLLKYDFKCELFQLVGG